MRIIKIIETTIEILSPIELFSDPNNLLKLLKHKYEKKCLKNMLIQTVLSIKDESPCEISPITKTGKMNVKFEVEGIEYAEAEIVHNAKIVNKDATRGSVIAVAPHTYIFITGDRTAESVLAVEQIIPVVNEKSCYRINSEHISIIGKMFTPGQYHSRRYNLYYVNGGVAPNELDVYIKKDLQQIDMLEKEIAMGVLGGYSGYGVTTGSAKGDKPEKPDKSKLANESSVTAPTNTYDLLREKLWPCKRTKESFLSEMNGKEKGLATELSLNGAKLVSIKSIVSNSKLQGWYVADDRFIYDGNVVCYDDSEVKKYEQYLSGLIPQVSSVSQNAQQQQQPAIRSITTPQLSRYNFITDIGAKEVILAFVNSYRNALYNLREFHRTYFEQKTNTDGIWEIFEASRK